MSQTFAGRRVLVVEDESLVAMLLETILEDMGCLAVGPAATVDEGLRMAADEAVDAALLDVNVAGVVRTTTAFLPLLREAPSGVVVNVSSGLGSHAVTSEPGRVESSFQAPAYTSSKASDW